MVLGIYKNENRRFISQEERRNYKNKFYIGQKLRIRYQAYGKVREIKTVCGKVIYKTDYFILLKFKAGYKESFKYIDFILGDIEIL